MPKQKGLGFAGAAILEASQCQRSEHSTQHPTPDRLPSRRGILNDLRVSVPGSHMAGAGPVRPFHPNVSSPLPKAFKGGEARVPRGAARQAQSRAAHQV